MSVLHGVLRLFEPTEPRGLRLPSDFSLRSLAIVLKEAVKPIKPEANFTLQIFAADPDKASIGKAPLGICPANIFASLSPARLRRCFVKEEGGCSVGKEIRETVTFATQDVVKDPSFAKRDILFSRNLLISLTPEVQKRLLPLFRYSLNPAGVLFGGRSESTSASAELFSPLSDILSPNLAEDAESVLQTLIFSERQIDTNDGRWFAVRIMPYRTMEGVIGGVVFTFFNITATKTAETKLL